MWGWCLPAKTGQSTSSRTDAFDPGSPSWTAVSEMVFALNELLHVRVLFYIVLFYIPCGLFNVKFANLVVEIT